jgi:hypothetical protein
MALNIVNFAKLVYHNLQIVECIIVKLENVINVLEISNLSTEYVMLYLWDLSLDLSVHVGVDIIKDKDHVIVNPMILKLYQQQVQCYNYQYPQLSIQLDQLTHQSYLQL